MARRPVDSHRFWRDPAVPYLEAREVSNGRAVCYGLHSHRTFSIGAVTGGRSDFVIGGARHGVAEGTVVLMNPNAVHACNPLPDLPWSYRMLYVDADWLTRVQRGTAFQPYAAVMSTNPGLYRDLNRLFDTLFDNDADTLTRDCTAAAFFADLHARLGGQRAVPEWDHPGLARAAAFISENCTRALRLDDICAASGLSPSYLVRAFKARYGLTPHAYQTNRRIQFGQEELRRGRPIADVALAAGFADQAHFQRVFKRHVAATPGQYAGAYASTAM